MKLVKILFFVVICLSLTGCYDKTELDNLAYVIGIGLDIGEAQNVEDDDSDGENLNITYQIAIPVKIAGENNSSGKETYTTYTVSASSLFMGNSIVNAMISKEINLSHINIILYSEEIAKKGLSGHINGLLSNTDIRPKTPVAICRGKASDFFNQITPVLETNPARYYSLILSSFNYTDESIGSELISFYSNAQSIDREASTVIGEISSEELNDSDSDENKDKAVFKGLAVFKAGTMVGEIPPKITDAHLLLTNALKRGNVTVKDPEDENSIATATIRQYTPTKINVDVKDKVPKVDITLFINAHFEASNSTTDYLNPENKLKLKKAIQEKITSNIYEYLNEIKKLDSDIVGIGKYAKVKCLTWEDYEDLHWQEIFKNSEFNVKVEVDLDISRIVFHKLPNQS